MVDADAIRQRWGGVGAKLDERGRRLFAAAEVRTAGRGGLASVAKITGLARSTINRGKKDLDAQPLPNCSHSLPIRGNRWPDDVRLSDIQDRSACTACADARPDFNWNTKPVGVMGYK